MEKKIQREGITIHCIEGDNVVEEWERYDDLDMMRHLGVVGEPG